VQFLNENIKKRRFNFHCYLFRWLRTYKQ